MFTVDTVWDNIDKVRGSAPVVHNITNYVVMNFSANTLLSAGASPIMAHAKDELDELVNIAGSLVLNIGTLSADWVESMHLASSIAAANYKPVILDPVGAGASKLRTSVAISLLEEGSISIVRGNASEILALNGADSFSRGVDACNNPSDAAESACELAKKYRCVVAISGCSDIITNGDMAYQVKGGSELMPLVTGMGCAATAICGAHAAITEDMLSAALSGMGCMAAAGGLAAAKSNGPGSFAVQFLDALHHVSESDVHRLVEIEEMI